MAASMGTRKSGENPSLLVSNNGITTKSISPRISVGKPEFTPAWMRFIPPLDPEPKGAAAICWRLARTPPSPVLSVSETVEAPNLD